ncbi:hypothetical protein BDV95DRAFT_610089 [Massariosphaeria phaeospora]|uniref:Uncharacterized protein n=1 Tax=Massariosphaeria phaeospora TaxID=100035 RepID=A0A7C8M4J8_9PLEO|nr:hypothetical protein BDV95DRAFT_610089 [Massariosphaeria phaeospora]
MPTPEEDARDSTAQIRYMHLLPDLSLGYATLSGQSVAQLDLRGEEVVGALQNLAVKGPDKCELMGGDVVFVFGEREALPALMQTAIASGRARVASSREDGSSE